ncbi:hypothetical protein [Sphingopyxis sp. A083]|uniref:hypothetical protein n=1 Tax=Sphingopyxis sp. A083 TaxID=1759083 RepID=UPI0007375C62|nr:hypothetical protein [Sphingopyxis sp. A083]KTE77661.1 hypothetical protein ATE59_05655 [Sphingopyxis sp. A083]
MFSIVLMVLATASPEASPKCSYDLRSTLLLDERAFDQDMNGGWRPLAANECYFEAAELIQKWRESHGAKDSTLYWHEGQMRASAGQYSQAVSLFEASRHPADQDRKWGWNLYVDGSIAFLKGDINALRSARDKLSVLPAPPELEDLKDINGNPSRVAWPMNLHVLDAFMRCWGQPYEVAYSCPK